MNAVDIMIILLICIAMTGVVAGYIYIKERRKQTTAATDEAVTAIAPDDLIAELGAQRRYKSTDGRTLLIEYQGGLFELRYTESLNLLTLSYKNIGEYGNENMVKALSEVGRMALDKPYMVCQIVNVRNKKGREMFRMNLCAVVNNMTDRKELADYVRFIMTGMFFSAREIADHMDRMRNQTVDVEALETDIAFANRVGHLREMGHMDALDGTEKEYPTETDMSVGGLVKLLAREKNDVPTAMTMVADGQAETLTDATTIMQFNVRDYLRERQGGVKELTLVLTLKHATMSLLLRHMPESTEKVLIYSMHTTVAGGYGDVSHSETMVEVHLTDAKEYYWEAQFMVADAHDKMTSGHQRDLTREQRLALQGTDPEMSIDLYWAKKLYVAHCLVQSLSIFMRIRQRLASLWSDMNESHRELFHRVSYHIGFIFMDLGQADTAFYYLHDANKLGQVDTEEEMVNALVALKDPEAAAYIGSLQRRTHRTITNLRLEGESSENVQRIDALSDMCQFLNRRMASVLIDKRDLDNAEGLLKDMLVNEVDVDFARNELNHIARLRREQSGGDVATDNNGDMLSN